MGTKQIGHALFSSPREEAGRGEERAPYEVREVKSGGGSAGAMRLRGFLSRRNLQK
jgi:hypothetical protein